MDFPTRENTDCIDGPGDCTGEVFPRESLTGSGMRINRCDGHWTKRLERQREIDERYPETQPADFDPSYAGESWYEEDDPRYSPY